MSTKEVYYQGVGRRKTATALVRLKRGKGKVWINEKEISEIDPKILAPLDLVGLKGKFDLVCKVRGGGLESQKEALRLGVARALLKFDLDLRSTLKKASYLKRDPRMKERKKPGLKRARKAPQWQKR